MREQLGLPGRSHLLSLGTLEPRKNLLRLLAAWAAACGQLPEDLWLVLAGEPGSRRIFKNVDFGSIPPRVHWTGRVPDELLPALYSGATAFLYVSLYEGFGLPPLEAMACGAPVVASDTTSLPEVVGDAALSVNPLESQSIADGIRQISTGGEFRDCLRIRGLERARGFTWEQAAEKTGKCSCRFQQRCPITARYHTTGPASRCRRRSSRRTPVEPRRFSRPPPF